MVFISNVEFFNHSQLVMDSNEQFTKRCRLSWLTNCTLVYEPWCGGRGGVAGSQPMSTAVHMSPNKLWRSYSMFNLWLWGFIKKIFNLILVHFLWYFWFCSSPHHWCSGPRIKPRICRAVGRHTLAHIPHCRGGIYPHILPAGKGPKRKKYKI